MFELNEKLRNLTPYAPGQGSYAVRLDANESFLPLPQKKREGLASILAEVDLRRYPDPEAAALCQAFAAYYGLRTDCVAAGNGSDELISVLTGAFLQRGDCALVADPDFSMYKFYLSLAEARVVTLDKQDGLRIDPDAVIARAREEKARMVIFSNPCNPTGQGLDRAAVRKIIRSTEALVVLDEAYMDFWDASLLQEVEEYDNLLILRTCSKAFGMAGLRLGFAVGAPKLIRAVLAAKSPYNVNSISQAIGAYLLQDRAWLADCTQRIRQAKNALYTRLCEVASQYPGAIVPVDTVTNFILVRTALAEQLFAGLKQQGILVRKMSGALLRITAGSEEENVAVAEGIRTLLKKEAEKKGGLQA